ncbi:hypothetical protein SDD30_07640 [Moorella naiadis]|uniref:hypothetical protein n=1 Tax=Moorella naiadis (nom. illeg.) TaxID=3093670 RepID=UPI003D9C8225
MNKHKDQLEELLAGLPTHTPPPLAGWHFSADLRQQVQKRAASLQDSPQDQIHQAGNGGGCGGAIPGLTIPVLACSSPKKVSPGLLCRLRHFRPGLVAGLIVIFVLLAWWYRPWDGNYWSEVPGGPPAGFQVKPIQYQWVNLNDPYREAVVSIGRVAGSNQLLAAISKRREPAGWQLIYTQPLNAYLVLPVKVVHANANQVTLILIAYQEQQEEGYRYLILSFDGERVIPYNQ